MDNILVKHHAAENARVLNLPAGYLFDLGILLDVNFLTAILVQVDGSYGIKCQMTRKVTPV